MVHLAFQPMNPSGKSAIRKQLEVMFIECLEGKHTSEFYTCENIKNVMLKTK